jgi:hypothetical protein
VRSRLIPVHTGPVSCDWRMPLKGDKSQAYLKCIHHLEITYAMFSVNLAEAFGMRRSGNSSRAHQLLARLLLQLFVTDWRTLFPPCFRSC